MGSLVRADLPRVPNPVNPQEDFADKWYDAEHANLHLEENFHAWLGQAKADFANLLQAGSVPQLQAALARYGTAPGQARLAEAIGLGAGPAKPSTVEPATRPWA